MLDLNTALTQPTAGSYGTNLIDNSFMTADTAIKPTDWNAKAQNITDGLNKVSNQASDLALTAIEWNFSIDAGDGTDAGETGYLRLHPSQQPAVQNDDFTISVYAKGSLFSAGYAFTITEQDGVSSTKNIQILRVPFIESDDFIRYHRTFTIEDALTTQITVDFGVFSVDPSSVCDVTMACPQLETGTSMTDYRTKDSSEGFDAFYAPVLPDGLTDVFGNTILNPGGYVHNGSEVSLIQTDADETVFGGATIWGNGTDTWVKVTYADFLAHTSGTQNTWLRWLSLNGVCLVKEDAQYDVTREFTPAENDKNERYFRQGTCGAGFAALRDVGGDLILDVGGNVIYTA
jgi:hypothetical protein